MLFIFVCVYDLLILLFHHQYFYDQYDDDDDDDGNDDDDDDDDDDGDYGDGDDDGDNDDDIKNHAHANRTEVTQILEQLKYQNNGNWEHKKCWIYKTMKGINIKKTYT